MAGYETVAGGGCLPLALLLAASLGPLVLLLAAAAYCSRAAAAFLAEDERSRATRRKVAELRARFRIRRRDGFLLSSERAPLWRRPASFTVLQEAQVRRAFAVCDLFSFLSAS